MKTYRRTAIKDFTIKDSSGVIFTILKGKKYLTSGLNESPPMLTTPQLNTVVVFSTHWLNIPIDVFGSKSQKFTN